MKSCQGRPPDRKRDDVCLFSTQNTVVAVDSPIKVLILELAAAGPIPFDSIVKRSHKAKSTISVHIRDLERSGLIVSHPEPGDRRRRTIMLSSDAIGRLTNVDRNVKVPHSHQHGAGREQPFINDDIVSFFRYCVQVFRTQAMVLGINIDPVLQRTGEEIGRTLAPRVAAGTIEGVVKKMNAFWQVHGLGEITLAGTTPLTLEVSGCFECEDLPVTGHGACAFDTGVLTAIFSHHFKCQVTVVEERCYSSGDDRCIFVVTPGNND